MVFRLSNLKIMMKISKYYLLHVRKVMAIFYSEYTMKIIQDFLDIK